MSSQSTHVYAYPRTSEEYMGEYADAPGTSTQSANTGEYPHLATQPGNAQHISNTLATH
jgi:hypothetical protein